MSRWESLQNELRAAPKTWLVTGCAGFIGSNLTEALLRLNQTVRGLDSFFSGYRHNLEQVRQAVTPAQWARFTFVEGDVRDAAACQKAAQGAQGIFHQAALCSVPGSIDDPLAAHAINVTGTVNLLLAARDQRVKSFVYASSSAVYGDGEEMPKVEARLGRMLSPYAVTKYVDELYAGVFAQCYGVRSVGLRYFNVFGPRQDPNGAYAAVIPKWIAAMIQGESVPIHGDGETTRDFCYIDNVVQANVLAAHASDAAINQVYNVALNRRTSLNELFGWLKERLVPHYPHLKHCTPKYLPFRAGDVRHSQADISRAASLLGYAPTHDVALGLDAALDWYRAHTPKG